MPYERKIINDPVFGFINIPKGLLYDIVRHPLLQRLTRIKQVGLSSVVYPGAQHTRFQHSLGAFHLMSEAIMQLASKGVTVRYCTASPFAASYPHQASRTLVSSIPRRTTYSFPALTRCVLSDERSYHPTDLQR